MDPVVEAMRRLGGVATRAELRALASKRQLRRSVEDGVVLRPRAGRYVLPEVDAARALAHELGATTTPPLRTVVDCARSLPFDEALAIADSALRSRSVRPADLARVALEIRGPGRPRVLRVLRLASGRAANPFESVLRAIALDVPGLDVRPQVGIAVASGQRVTPDLVDGALGIVLEADSHEFHTGREQLVVDCWRYDELVLGGWDVYRFTYEHVMHRQAWTRSVLVRAEAKARATHERRVAEAP